VRVRTLVRLALAVVIAGALLAAAALSWAFAPGLALDKLVHLNVPSTAAIEQPPTGNTQVLAADGSVIAQFYRHNRIPVTADQIAPVMKQALIDVEDSRFYEHGALDPIGTLRAVITDLRSGSGAQGGSTLTQQLVKQTLLQQAATPAEQRAADAPTLARKLTEARLATALAARLSKDEILTRYLNTVYFGAGAFGVQAAAQTYFSTDAADLTLPQAAVLAGLVQSPSADDPLRHPDAAATRRNEVLTRMHDLGHLSAADLTSLTAAPVAVQPGPRSTEGCQGATVGGFFCNYLQHYLTDTLTISQQQLEHGGLTIQTTLNPDIQRAGDQAVLQTLSESDPRAGIYTVVEPGTGKVLAMSVNRRFGCSDPDCTSVNLNASAAAGSGSTYKLFTATAALESGYALDFTQTTSDPYVSRVYKQNGGTSGAPYVVQNVGHYPATLNMAEALVRSSNTYFVGLEDRLGSIDGPVHAAQQLGLSSVTDEIASSFISGRFGSFTLGPIPTSPLALADAYATIFSGGTRCDPTPVTAVLASDGSPLTGSNGAPLDVGTHCTAGVVPAGLAHTLSQVLRGDVESTIGTATRANIPGHQIAGKTGTSQNNFSVAFVGSTPEYTASVMVENPNTLQDVGGFGGGKGAQIWHDAMTPILSAGPTASFPPADAHYLGQLARVRGSSCTFQVGNLQLPC
jgi:membrane peptidoglycan carboxypeptidase